MWTNLDTYEVIKRIAQGRQTWRTYTTSCRPSTTEDDRRWRGRLRLVLPYTMRVHTVYKMHIILNVANAEGCAVTNADSSLYNVTVLCVQQLIRRKYQSSSTATDGRIHENQRVLQIVNLTANVVSPTTASSATGAKSLLPPAVYLPAVYLLNAADRLRNDL